MHLEKYNVIIIGAGPIGLACAVEAEKKKLSYLVIEAGCLVNSCRRGGWVVGGDAAGPG
jgi:thioredoxin reductase